MPYSGKDLEEIGKDRDRLRCYFWRMAQHWRRMAARDRAASKVTGQRHPVTNYRSAFDEGREMLRHAEMLERGAAVILENLDAFVESTVEE